MTIACNHKQNMMKKNTYNLTNTEKISHLQHQANRNKKKKEEKGEEGKKSSNLFKFTDKSH